MNVESCSFLRLAYVLHFDPDQYQHCCKKVQRTCSWRDLFMPRETELRMKIIGGLVFLLGAFVWCGNVFGFMPTVPMAGYLIMLLGGWLMKLEDGQKI